MTRLLTLVLALSLAAPLAQAQQAPYRDDRSDPAALVESLLNAIGRHEYARAWSYWETPPVGSYADFVAGYAGSTLIDHRLGPVTIEGAAGSLYGTVPVVLKAREADGREVAYAGCYVTRISSPAAQEPPFRPMVIVAGRFVLDDRMPVVCAEDGMPGF